MAHELGHAIAGTKLFADQPSEKVAFQRKLNTGKITVDVMHTEYTNSFDGEMAEVIKKRFSKNPGAVVQMIDELLALQQRGIVSVLEGQPAVIRDSYIDIFDVLNADMRSAGLTQDRAVTSIRNNPKIKETIEGVSINSKTTRNAQRNCLRPDSHLHGRSSIHERGRPEVGSVRKSVPELRRH